MPIGSSRFDSVPSSRPVRMFRHDSDQRRDRRKDLPTSAEWVVETLGIRQRRVAERDEYTSDLAVSAGLNAIAAAGPGTERNRSHYRGDLDTRPQGSFHRVHCAVQDGNSERVRRVRCGGGVFRISIRAHDRRPIHREWRVRACAGDRRRHILQSDELESPQVACFSGMAAAPWCSSADKRENGLFSTLLRADGEGMDDFTILPGERLFHDERKGGVTRKPPPCCRSVFSRFSASTGWDSKMFR